MTICYEATIWITQNWQKFNMKPRPLMNQIIKNEIVMYVIFMDKLENLAA